MSDLSRYPFRPNSDYPETGSPGGPYTSGPVSNAAVQAVWRRLNRIFRDNFNARMPMLYWNAIATLVPSMGPAEQYNWLGQFPHMDVLTPGASRAYSRMKEFGYFLPNPEYGSGIKVRFIDIEDARFGGYEAWAMAAGSEARRYPERMVMNLLKRARLVDCYDGKKLAATDHPVFPSIAGTGTVAGTSNILTPATTSGAEWFLLDCSGPLRPLIYQRRRQTMMDRVSANDFASIIDKREVPITITGRGNFGVGEWRQIVTSRTPLTSANYEAARAMMRAFTWDGGDPAGFEPTHLCVPTSLEGAGKRVLEAALIADATAAAPTAGGSNVWNRSAMLVCTSFLN